MESTAIYRKYCHWFARALVIFLFWVTGGYSVKGLQHVPKSGAVLLVSNHISLADPVAILVAVPRPLCYMAASELHKIPGLGPLIRFMGAFAVKRGVQDTEAIATCRRLLKQGEGVVMYPEGKLSADGRLGPMQDGVALLAFRSNCPIVPVAVHNTDKLLPMGSKWLHRSYKSIAFGPALNLGSLQKGVPLKEQLAQANAKIRQALVELGLSDGLTIES